MCQKVLELNALEQARATQNKLQHSNSIATHDAIVPCTVLNTYMQMYLHTIRLILQGMALV